MWKNYLMSGEEKNFHPPNNILNNFTILGCFIITYFSDIIVYEILIFIFLNLFK